MTKKSSGITGLQKNLKSSLPFGIGLKCGLHVIVGGFAQWESEQEICLPSGGGSTCPRQPGGPGRVFFKLIQSMFLCVCHMLIFNNYSPKAK